MSKSKPNSGKKQENDLMKHYLYVDMDFINSFLAQSKQGLHLTSRHTNANTDNNFEDRTSQLVTVDAKTSKRSNPTAKVSLLGSALDFGGNSRAHGDVAATIEGLKRGEYDSSFTEHAIEVAIHDYAINLFIESVDQQIKNSKRGSQYFISSNKEWNLLDYSNSVGKKMRAYLKMFETDLISDPDSHKVLSEILPQAEAIAEVLAASLPTPYAIREGNRVGHLNPNWMRYSMDSMIFEFGTKQKFKVLGIKTSSARPSISEDTLENPHKMFTAVSPYLDEHFLPMATEMKNSDQIFKPIVIYMEVE